MDVETIAIALYLAVANVAAFVCYGVDKRRAERGEWRIPERTLLTLAFLGGGLGAFLGMHVFHHKTRKLRFRLLAPLALVLSVVVGGSALYFSVYYHADAAVLEAVETPEGGLEIRTTGGGDLAFVPQDARVGMVFYPGAKVQPEAYAPMLEACATRGVLCVLVCPPLNFALTDVSAAQGAMDEFPQVERWILAGHSLGGVAAAQYASEHLQDVDAMVFLASYPASDLTSLAGPTLFIVGSNDKVLNRGAYADAWAKLPAGAQELVIEGGNHAYYGNYGEQAGDGAATITREEQQAQTVEAIVALAERL